MSQTHRAPILVITLALLTACDGERPGLPDVPQSQAAPLSTNDTPHDGAGLPRLTIAWETQEEDSLVGLADTRTLVLTAHGDQPPTSQVLVRLYSPLPDGTVAHTDVATTKLDGGETVKLLVSVDRFPFRAIGLTTSVRAEAIEIRADDSGTTAETSPPLRVFSEARYLSRENASQYRLCDEDALRTKHNGGIAASDKRSGEVWDDGDLVPLDLVMARNARDRDPADGEAVVASMQLGSAPAEPGDAADAVLQAEPTGGPAPAYASSCTNPRYIRVCARWGADYVDAGFGEDYLNSASFQTSQARSTLAVVQAPDGSYPHSGYLDATGCTTTFYDCPGTYQLYVYSTLSEASRTITARRCASPTSCTSPATETQMYTFSVPTSGATTVTVYPTTFTQASNAMAVATRAIATVDMTMAAATHYITVNADTSESPNNEAKIGRETTWPYTDDAHWKYIIGHELGHAIAWYTWGRMSTDYTSGNSSIPACRSDGASWVTAWEGSAHIINSQEQSFASAQEAFGHFAAAKMFNYASDTNPKLVYYKHTCDAAVSTSCSSILAPPWALNVTDNVKWLETYCGSPSNRAVERDWTNFLWRWNRNSVDASSFTTISPIFKAACGTGGGNCASGTAHWFTVGTAPGFAQAGDTVLGFGTPARAWMQSAALAAGINH